MMFNIGDTIQVRDWHDMVSQYGLDKDSDILVKHCFSKKMKDFCGQQFKVVKANWLTNTYWLAEIDSSTVLSNKDKPFEFSNGMFEKMKYKPKFNTAFNIR